MAEYTNVVISGTTRRVNTGDTYTSTTVTAAGLLEMVAGSACATTLTNDGRLWMQGGAYASGVRAGGGSCRISAYHTGTILEDVHIDSGVNTTGVWRLDIRAGVVVSNAVVSGAAIQHTGANAVIRNLVMDEGAMLYTYNYASAYNVTVVSANASQLRLYNHGYIDNITISKGNLQIFGAGFAENVHIYDKVQIWSSGTDGAGSANLVTVYKGGTLEVLTSAVASNVTVSGVMKVGSAAVVSGVSAFGDNTGGATGSAYVLVSSGGRLVGGVVSGARVDVSSGCSAENIVVSGGYGLVVRSATAINCSAVGATGNNYIFIQQGSILRGGYFADHGRLRLEAGCSALDVVFENCAANANFIIGTGAYTSDYTLRGDVTGIEMRGTALDGKVSGGTLNFTSGGTLAGLTVSNGGNFNVGTAGDITDVTFKAGGQFNGKFSWDYDFTLETIANGSAVIADNVVVSAARMNVGDGGTASGTTVAGGTVVVAAGGLFTNGAILGTNTGGGTTADYAVIRTGGKIADTTVSGARVDVSAGASGENIVVTGGYGLVVRGATATNCSAVGTAAANYIFVQSDAVLSGGYFTGKGEARLSTGSATDLVFENGGGALVANNCWTSKLTLRGNATNINYAGTVFDATVSGGTLNYSSGTLTGLTVSAGTAKISSGGVVNGLTVSAGTAQVFEAGLVDTADVKSGATLYASKGTVGNVTLELGGALSVRDGGYASGVSGSGYVEVYAGTVSSAAIANGSSFRVYAPGYAEDVQIDNTEVVVRGAGAVLSGANISGGKITSIQNNGIARDLTRTSGRLRIDVKGSAAGTVSGATLTSVWTEIFDTGILSGFTAAAGSTYVYTGAQLLDGTALAGNSIYVSGGVASAVTVESGARIQVSSGGLVAELSLQGGYAEVNAGGNISGAIVASNLARADFRVYDGLAEDVELTGGIVVVRGANASGSNISAAGNGNTVHAQASGRIDGVRIEDGAQLLVNSQGGTVGGSVFSAILIDAKTNIHHQGLVSGFDAAGGSIFVDSGAKLEDGIVADDAIVDVANGAVISKTTFIDGTLTLSGGATGKDVTALGGTVNIASGVAMTDFTATEWVDAVNFTCDKAGATFAGANTNIAEGTLWYSFAGSGSEGALDPTLISGRIEGGVIRDFNADVRVKLSIGDDIIVSGGVIDQSLARLSCFGGASVDGTVVSAGAIICNAGASGTMDNVTLVGTGIMNLSGTAKAHNTVVGNGGQFAINAAEAGAENTTLKVGGTVKFGAAVTGRVNTGDKFTLDFGGTTGATMKVSLAKLATSTTVCATGVDAAGTYTLGSAGTVDKVTRTSGLYAEELTANGAGYTNGIAGLTYTFDGAKLTAADAGIAAVAAAAKLADGATSINSGDLAAKWDATTTYSTNVFLADGLTTGNVWLDIDGFSAGNANLYGAAKDQNFAGTVNIGAISGTIKNLAAGAGLGGSVAGVKLTVGDGMTVTGAVYAGGMGDVTGKTETLVEGGSFAGNVFAGALCNCAANNLSTSAGDIEFTVDGGTFNNNIYAGAAVKAGTATTVVHSAGDITVKFAGGAATKDAFCVYGGGYATGTAANELVYMAGNVDITVNGGAWGAYASGRGIFGGAYADTARAATGNAYITVNGGSMGNIYGGGWAQNGGFVHTGNIRITIAGDAEVANVFGGGSYSSVSGGTTEVGSVTIRVEGGSVENNIFACGQGENSKVYDYVEVTFAGSNDYTCNVYGYGAAASATVTDDRTLSFEDYTGTLSGDIGGFDAIEFAGDTAATLSGSTIDNAEWAFDYTGRTLDADLAMATFDNGSFTGDTVFVDLSDVGQAADGWSIAAGLMEADATFNVGLATGTAEDLRLDDTLDESYGIYEGWGFALIDNTLKFKQLA